MQRSSPDPPWRAGFERAVFLLLVVNAVVFAVDGTLAEALDSIAWLLLLAMFMLETAHAPRFSSRHALRMMHAVRFVAALAVVVAAVRYVEDEDWLDAANAWLWIAVVAVLELEVRYVRNPVRRLGVLGALAGALYAGLAALVGVWVWRGEWFDAYDAVLWLVAFVAIEMNMMRAARARPTEEQTTPDRLRS